MKIRIAYALSGEGKGHAVRTTAISHKLDSKYELIYYCPIKVHEYLQNNLENTKLRTIPGWYFHIKEGKVLYGSTVKQNFDNIFRKQKAYLPLCEQFKKDNIQAIITDYEPFSALAAKKLNLPVLNIGHPGVVNIYPKFSIEWFSAKIVSMQMMPWANRYIISSFYNGDVGPIIRQEIIKSQPTRGNHITVYAKENTVDLITQALKNCGIQDYNLFPNTNKDFIQSLCSCKAVIAPGGHQMISEALYLKKPILAFPIKGHYEQNLNTEMLLKSGWGMKGNIDSPEEDISLFLSRLNSFPFKKDTHSNFMLKDDTSHICLIIDNFIKQFVHLKKPNFFRYPLNRWTQQGNHNHLVS